MKFKELRAQSRKKSDVTGGSMRIDDDMNIAGPVPALGNSSVAINGRGQSRLFFIGNRSVTISNLILENGRAQGGENALNTAGAQTIQLAGTSLGLQTITFPSISTQTVGTPLPLAATASSGLAVSFTSFTPAVCSVSSNTAIFLTYGSCTLTATQSGHGTYLAVNSVS